ncbi:MAG: GNAT family N-acetyltransferase [Acholeplasmataceae bacterium]|nr:GNAT family N-acetyltransferase [Acholeplasmataceae bacterium]MDD4468583.1 GNAT family N-acetyltransferase [Acholeplasmataceae bacterium]MDD4823901.1 GNAT family N-acetyltransferase [Acholeplasmataceae bacterium]
MKTDNMPEVSFGTYKLRTLLKKDAHDYYEIGKDPINIKYLTWRPFKTLTQAKSAIKNIYYKRLNHHEPIGYAIIDIPNNKMIGIIEFHTFDYAENSAQVGYLLHKDYWGEGIMSQALKELIKVGFETLNLNKIIIKSIKENVGSRKVIEHNNLVLIDILKLHHYHVKTKTYHDVFVYEIERKHYYGTKTKGDL